MNLITVGTGSEQGNCYLLEKDDKYLVLDCGCQWKQVMVACDWKVLDIDFAVMTHRHGDHSRYAQDLIRNGISVITNDDASKAVSGALRIRPNKEFRASGWSIIPFRVPHTNTDGTDCENYAYMVSNGGERLLYMTDWMYCPYNLSSFHINHFLIAINYTDDVLEGHVLKGHASLDTAVKFLETSMTDDCRSVTACHLSDRNSDENLIQTTLRDVCGEHVQVNIARKGQVIEF